MGSIPKSLISLLLAASVASASVPLDSHWNTLISNLSGRRLFAGEPVEYGVFYPRMIRIEHSHKDKGALLATYEHFPHLFEIYRSDDDGGKWRKIAIVPSDDHGAGWVFEGEPDLFELPQKAGDLEAGTLLLVGSSIHAPKSGRRLQQRLEIYVSFDHGITWRYHGLIDQTNGPEGSIWEPNIQLAADGRLVAYYSDERLQPKFSQVLALRVSGDGGKTWGPQENIVAVPDGRQRPGMAIVKRMGDGRYIMSYEWMNGEENPMYIRISKDGIHWGDPNGRGIPVQSATGSSLGMTPYIVWTPFGGEKGTVVALGRSLNKSPNVDREVFMNFNGGEGPWVPAPAPVQWQGNQEFDGWSGCLLPTRDGTGILHMGSSYAGKSINEMLVGSATLLVPGQNYALLNNKSGMAITLPKGLKPGDPLTQQPFTGAPDQRFQLTDLGDAKFGIWNPGTNLALDDFEFKSNNGSLIAAYPKNFVIAQQWRFLPTGAGTYRLLNVNANRVLGVWDQSTEKDAKLPLWDDDGTPDHEWILKPL